MSDYSFRAPPRPIRPTNQQAPAPPPLHAQTLNPSDLSELLYAFGANPPYLPLTLTTLSEILTDFIIETCHAAALSASYSRRQKIKVDDFKWVLRNDGALLGRVLEQLWKERAMKEERKGVDLEGMQRLDAQVLLAAAGTAGDGDAGEKAGGRRGKKGKKKRAESEEGTPEEKRRRREG
ncbi:hypothetical protein M433DRAFT_158446 [Acidomyces richmondensis BFW]|nr:MAG: hypothetical protein FE78DRAFT_84100 [Acidomyces sp. 'richmondensis']KYG41968.1 hypothetical protein M433DRAFT_158446 [Acidomyces richmondensis BFW]